MKILIATSFLLCCLAAKAQNADRILGHYLTQDGDSQVTISKKTDGKYYGKIVWLKNPYRENGSIKLDDENPDEKLQKRTIMGLELLSGFGYDADDQEWENGTIYDPKSGSTYKCYMWFDKNNENVLNVKGYIGFSLIGRSVTWTREAELRKN